MRIYVICNAICNYDTLFNKCSDSLTASVYESKNYANKYKKLSHESNYVNCNFYQEFYGKHVKM